MNIAFTDIDGVLRSRLEWNQTAISLYNDLCEEFDLKAVVTSTWRLKHSQAELQRIFRAAGITAQIYDYTEVFPDEGRGAEIENWLFGNTVGKFIILDDNVRDIEALSLPNVVRTKSWIGLSQEEYERAREILLKQKI